MLISAEELHTIIRTGAHPAPVVLDVRWKLGQVDGRGNYDDGHIPSASFVDLDRDLAGRPVLGGARHPLPHPETWAETLRRWGLDNDSRVVIYDDMGGTVAARAWWMLRWAGLRTVKILDGGWQAWTRGQFPVAVGPGNPVWPGTFQFVGPSMPVAQIADVERWTEHGTLLDARLAGRYTGKTGAQVDRRIGHIPGAKNMPALDLVGEDMTFLTPEEIRSKLAARGIGSAEDAKEVAAYCGSGVNATQVIFAMELAGLPGASLYPGSWSEWGSDRRRPAETGL